MVRLHLFAEGQTEQTFANSVLKRHLASFVSTKIELTDVMPALSEEGGSFIPESNV